MSEAKKSKTWLEVQVERDLAKGAVLPPSQEQIEHAVSLKRSKLTQKRVLDQAKSDIELDTLLKASKAKNN